MSAARWGNETAKGNEHAAHYQMEEQDLPDGQLTYWTACCARTAQTIATSSHEFWDNVLGYSVRENNMHAMVVDTLTTWYLGYTSRIAAWIRTNSGWMAFRTVTGKEREVQRSGSLDSADSPCPRI